MRIAVFFMYLCFFLLKGDASIYAAPHNNGNGNTIAQHVKEKHKGYFTNTIQRSSTIEGISIDAEKGYFISDDVEDEDTNNCPAEKYKLLARSHPTHAYPAYPSILNYLCNCFKASPSICIPASDKYILQGVLRI